MANRVWIITFTPFHNSNGCDDVLCDKLPGCAGNDLILRGGMVDPNRMEGSIPDEVMVDALAREHRRKVR